VEAETRRRSAAIPEDYAERVYAGVLGKIIGVYLGRPFEGWTYDRIRRRFGQIRYYVHQQRGLPLVVTDDDITGTFTFVRALDDSGRGADLTPADVADAWLNYVIEERTIFWWGGVGNSTEHTAFVRLRSGIPAPESGSIATNGKVMAEQIGAQIFIDGWGMVSPGDPELAARLAASAARVSHDGEAVHAAQLIAAMEAEAFSGGDLDHLLDTGLAQIPGDSLIARLVARLREWRAAQDDWRVTRQLVEADFGYDSYPGNCHVVPNHALVVLALLYGGDDLQEALSVVNSCGWDTDCNSGNVGCLLGIKNGLAGIDAGPDWRGPIADRMYLPTASGEEAITDAATQAGRLADLGRRLAGQPADPPKGGARFHFDLPGSVQGWQVDARPDSSGTTVLENLPGHSAAGSRSLAVRYRHLAPGRLARAATATFIPPSDLGDMHYQLLATPTLHPGQRVRAAVEAGGASSGPVRCRLYIRTYATADLTQIDGPAVTLEPGRRDELAWRVPDCEGHPIAEIGIEIESDAPAEGTVHVDLLTWEGEPEVVLGRPSGGAGHWRRAWVDAVDHYQSRGDDYRISQDRGTGLLIQGGRQWRDYEVAAPVTVNMARGAGIAARVQGLRRYYALLLSDDDRVRLVKAAGGVRVLAEAPLPQTPFQSRDLALRVRGEELEGLVDGEVVLTGRDRDPRLAGGGVALVCDQGTMTAGAVRVRPLSGGDGPEG
jgi:ADP-ribosylglycohydrolase